MTCFPDVNVWIALHLAFCRVTQMGFLRLLTNPVVMKADVMTIQSAWQAFENLMKSEGIVFVSEPPGIEDLWRKLIATQQARPNYWTDSYLAAFARRTGHTLVTFDRGFRKFSGLPVQIIGIPAH